MMIDFAKEMGIFEDIFKMEKLEGRDYLYKTLQEFVEPTIFLERIQEESEDYNTIFITGVGKVFPF